MIIYEENSAHNFRVQCECEWTLDGMILPSVSVDFQYLIVGRIIHRRLLADTCSGCINFPK